MINGNMQIAFDKVIRKRGFDVEASFGNEQKKDCRDEYAIN